MNICIYLLAKLFYMWCNRKREKEWNAMTEEVSTRKFAIVTTR